MTSMATPGVSRLFLDTNVLVHATSADSPWQAAAEGGLEAWRQRGTALYVSVQVLREYLAVTTRPAPGQTTLPDYTAIRENPDSFRKVCHVLEETTSVADELENLVARFAVKGRQVHDANLVAIMRVHGLQDLFTHNVSDFTRFAALVTVHPLGDSA
jgi:predicted nucleic acid-binding protein